MKKLLLLLFLFSGLVVGQTRGILYGYVTFPSDIDLSGPYPGVGSLGGRMPVDSLPWEVLSHLAFFAADVNADGTWRNTGNGPAYLYKMPYLAEQAHIKGVYAGFCFGGSGDAGIRAAMSDLNAHANLIATCLDLIDNRGQDFIDFDIEGTSWNETNATIFLSRLWDSLQTRTNALGTKPFLVLTVGAGVALGARGDVMQMEPYIEILNIMSYDKAGSWWGQITHDCAVTSWENLDGTGENHDPMNYAGQGGKAFPSMQEEARLLIDYGWPRRKIVVGADFNPTTVTGGTFSDGRGPTTIRKVFSSPPSYSGSGLKFYREWNAGNNLSAIAEINYDPISNVYWAHTGTDHASDKIYLQTSWPGKDESILKIRQMVEAMGIGGTMIWGLTETYGTSSPAPVGGWAWLGNQYEKYFAGGVVIPPDTTPPPPPPPSGCDTVYITRVDTVRDTVYVEPPQPPAEQFAGIYLDEKLEAPWILHTWGVTNNLASPFAQSGTSWEANFGAWGAIGVHSGPWGQEVYVNPAAVASIKFDVYSQKAARFKVTTTDSPSGLIDVPADQWVTVTVPGDAITAPFHSIHIQNNSGSKFTAWFDNIKIIIKQ